MSAPGPGGYGIRPLPRPLRGAGAAARTRRWRRALSRRRRWIAAALAAVAVWAAVTSVKAPAAPTEPVQVAAGDLPAGHRLVAADLTSARWPRGSRPAGAVADPRGRVLASPLRRGEPVTDARLSGRGLLTGQPDGTVAVGLRLTDPAAAAMLRPGDRVDVLAGPADVGTGGDDADVGARRVASAALLLAVGAPAGADGAGAGTGTGAGAVLPGQVGAASGEDGGLLVLAVDRDTAVRLASTTGRRSITVALTGGP